MIKDFLRNIFAKLEGWASSPGRGVDYDTRTYGQGLQESQEEQYNPDRPSELILDPYIFSGMRFRDIGYLWQSAKGFGDVDNQEEPYSPPQITFPPFTESGEDDQLRFMQWIFDERLQVKGMRSVISEIQKSYLAYGRAIVEVNWKKETQGDYQGNIIFTDLLVRDPQKFVIDPKGLEPGIYLKENSYNDTVGKKDRMPDKKFMLFTNHLLFENRYGISEVLLLDAVQEALKEIFPGIYARGLERNGVGALVFEYTKQILGKNHDEDRQNFYNQMKKISSDTVSIVPPGTVIHELSNNIADGAFNNFIKTAISQISLVLTGNPTTLIETENGTYGMEESKGTREKSNLEQSDATLISEAFSYQLIPWCIDFNYNDVQSYPWMFLIQPEYIQPTVSESQKDLIEIQQDEEENERTEGDISDENKKQDRTLTKKEKNEPDIDVEPEKEFLKLFVEEEPETDEDVKKKPDYGEKFPDFPSADKPPEIFNDVTDAAKDFIDNMPVYVSQVFDKLPRAEQNEAFTMRRSKRMKNQNALLTALKDAIGRTIEITQEDKAWQQYLKEARAISKEFNSPFTPAELIPAFRITRQRAYNAGIKAMAESDKANIHGYEYKTQEDGDVRLPHRRLEGIVRPVDDPVWKKLTPPIDWECRCYLDIVSKTEYERNPDKYQYTDKLPEIPKGWQ